MKPEMKRRAEFFGCFSTVPKSRRQKIAGIELERCPNYYLQKVNPEDMEWVSRIIELYNWWKKGSLGQIKDELTLAEEMAINIVDQEIRRIEIEATKKAQREAEKSKGK